MLNNYNKPTPRRWRYKGDTAVLIALVLWLAEDFVAAAPESIMSPEMAHWVVKGIGAIALLYKFYTNTKFDPSTLKT